MKSRKLNYLFFTFVMSLLMLCSGVILINCFKPNNTKAANFYHTINFTVVSNVYKDSGRSSYMGQNIKFFKIG